MRVGGLGLGFLNTLQPLNFLMIVLGLGVGIVAGALPGITMLNAIVLVLPFTYLMGIVPSLLLMIGVYCGGVFGGSITGILFNIPGDPMNVPTTWEVMPGDQRFYGITKTIHNTLHGWPGALTPEDHEYFHDVNRRAAQELALDGDLVLIHDPQPAAVVLHRKRPGQRWVWRCLTVRSRHLANRCGSSSRPGPSGTPPTSSGTSPSRPARRAWSAARSSTFATRGRRPSRRRATPRPSSGSIAGRPPR